MHDSENERCQVVAGPLKCKEIKRQDIQEVSMLSKP